MGPRYKTVTRKARCRKSLTPKPAGKEVGAEEAMEIMSLGD